jgi:hypothetical protein
MAYLAKSYNKPYELMVNTDQTGIHLIQIRGIRTWKEKGAKSVAVIGQVTATILSSSVGDMLPF